MSILDLQGNIMKKEDGLEVLTGGNFQVGISKTSQQNEEIDFTDSLDKKGKYLIYPTNVGLTSNTAQLTQNYVGSKTQDIYPGATTHSGDLGFGGFPNSNAFYSSLMWADVRTKAISNSIIVISGMNNFSLKFSVADTVDYKVNRLEILTEKSTGGDYDSRFIEITNTMTNKQLVEAINNFDDFSARIQIGSEDTVVDFSQFLKDNKLNNNLVFGYTRIAFIESGALTDEEKAKYPNFINIMQPREGEPQYFNVLVSQIQNRISSNLYYGCQVSSFNLTFSNQALTAITASLLVSGAKTINEAIKMAVERTENRDVVMAQTKQYPTKVYISGLEAMAISDINVAISWTKEEAYNISVIAYNIPNGQYTCTIGGNAMFNKQSDELLYNRILEGQRQSMIIESYCRLRSKDYYYIMVFCDVSGQPSKPAIAATGNLQVALNGFQAMEQSNDNNSNYIIVFTDREDLF